MAALTETSSQVTEFAGKYKVVGIEFDGATGTQNTLTVDELDTIDYAVGSLIEQPTADCCGVVVEINSSTTNQLDVTLIEGDGTPNTQNALDGHIIAFGH